MVKTAQPNWVAKAHLNYDFFSLSAVAETYRQELVDLIGFPFNYKYENLDVFYDQNNVERHAQMLNENKALLGRSVMHIEKKIKTLLAASKKYGDDLRVEAFTNWYKVYRQFLPVLGTVFGIELALERKLKSFLDENQFHTVVFAKETTATLEQQSLLQLASLPRTSKEFSRALKKHVTTYAWLGNKMMSYTPFTEQQILSRLETVGEKPLDKLVEIQTNRKHLEREAKLVIKILTPEQKELVKMYQQLLLLRTERADAVCKAAQLTYPLFFWVAEELGMTRQELVRFSKSEIEEMINTGKRSDAGKREKYHATFINGKFDVHWGSWGEEEKQQSGVKEIKGVIACKGLARGTVKIIRDVPEQVKVERGDILVASYTNPNMVPAMERAAAIITNIGGLTSHAAIVSREMNKPCIIGTKIATQVLKDGDEVEVDADQGVVRVLSNDHD